MAAKSTTVQVIGKRIVNGVLSRAVASELFTFRGIIGYRNGHTSTYAKNVEEELQSSKVPDELIKPHDSDEYWSPHPQTGVFGPSSSSTDATDEKPIQEDSVMEEKAWFRPTSLEDLDKTSHRL